MEGLLGWLGGTAKPGDGTTGGADAIGTGMGPGDITTGTAALVFAGGGTAGPGSPVRTIDWVRESWRAESCSSSTCVGGG
jgi:hypothetical protein